MSIKTPFSLLVSLAILVSLLAGCQPGAPAAVEEATSPPASSTPAPTSTTAVPTETPTPSITPTATASQTPGPTSTSEPTEDPILSPAGLRAALQTALDARGFPIDELPDEKIEQWTRFADGKVELPEAEQAELRGFLEQWQLLVDLLSENEFDEIGEPSFRVIQTEGEGEETGELVPYLVRQTAQGEAFYLLAKDDEDHIMAITQAPEIPDLKQRIHPDGKYVDYLDGRGRLMLIADANWIDPDEIAEIEKRFEDNELRRRDLLKQLQIALRKKHGAPETSVFTRYRIAAPEIEIYFYGLEHSLSAQQIVLLNETFEIFDRPEFEPLKEAFFSKGISIFFQDELGRALGLNFHGTQIILLDRRDLFGNRYLLANVLAHEGTHAMQRQFSLGSYVCDSLLQMEIGNKTIPPDFYKWTAEELLQGIRTRRLGAYHTSLWMLFRLGYSNLDSLRSVITTGRVNGEPLLPNCP